jgi:hypothetical protein
MKVMAIIIGLAIGGLYIDHQYYHGRYSHALVTMSKEFAVHFGLR